ncbi:MAG: VWA domain-containing protein [Chromatiaceae bacterium]|nr:VWA domain-containing protein [Chromatiaceae bacterium]
MSKLKEYTVAMARPLPVIVLADVSGSMAAAGKIDALNTALSEMIAAFVQEDAAQAEIHVAVITFGAEVRLHQALAPARDVAWQGLRASGRTPMGAAFDLARDLIEDRSRIPGRAYRPTIVLVSDGLPTDTWSEPLQRLLGSERAGKDQRFALGIGADANRDMLAEFLADPAGRVYEAHESRQIRNFFRWVTMSVSQRTRSVAPNQSVMIAPEDLDDYDDF